MRFGRGPAKSGGFLRTWTHPVVTLAAGVLLGSWLLGAPGALVGGVVAVLCLLARAVLTGSDLVAGVGTFVGIGSGAGVAWLLSAMVSGRTPAEPSIAAAGYGVRVLFGAGLVYLGGVLGRRLAGRLAAGSSGRPSGDLVLDTSVIIDGRILAVIDSGFLDGRLVVPGFVLEELQQVADSTDSQKRNRGRRGLDMLRAIQARDDIQLEIDESTYGGIPEVDLKLVACAKDRLGSVVTTDFNLNKVADLRGVHVLNINDLASALKPVVLVGETLSVPVSREGREPEQGVAYLDDGTMVVVEGGRRAIGRSVDVVVTSVHQSSAGRMIFSKMEGDGDGERRDSRRRWNRPAERQRSTR